MKFYITNNKIELTLEDLIKQVEPKNAEFRAWDKKLKQMEEVVLIDCFNKKICCHPDYADWRDFANVVLMQYTGYKDNNKTKIFPGDFVKAKFNGESGWRYEIGVVVHTNEGFKIFWPTIEEFNYTRISDFDGNLEVVGNLFENPELLKEVNHE